MSIPSVQARLALLLVLGACTTPETYGFVAILGNDTTSVERVTRTGHRITGDPIGRSPTVTRRHWEADLGPSGAITHWSMAADIPNAPPDGRHLHHTARFTDKVDAFTRGTSAGTKKFAYRKRCAETVPWNANVYATWELLLDAARFAADEKRTGLATSLSPRDTVRATVGTAEVTVDSSRPSRRGRTLVGALIRYDQVWRTGANAATQLSTTAPIELAGVPLQAGTYTLWTLPTRGGVSLIINGQSGQWGTTYHAGRDVARRPMTVDSLPQNVERFTIRIDPAGRLVMEWGSFQWSAAIGRRQGLGATMTRWSEPGMANNTLRSSVA